MVIQKQFDLGHSAPQLLLCGENEQVRVCYFYLSSCKSFALVRVNLHFSVVESFTRPPKIWVIVVKNGLSNMPSLFLQDGVIDLN